MKKINTISFTEKVKNWLSNSGQPKILHVFDNACNLINEDREVLSIVTPQIGNGPFNLVVNNKVLFSDYLSVESPVSILSNQIALGDLTINTANAELWNPCPAWELLHAKRNEILNQLTKLPISDYEPLLPNSLISNFSFALANADISTAKSLTSQLAGLGIGLTPSGDDFIMGATYATWIIHPFDIASVLAREITNTATPLTTSLSATWLRSAGKGGAGILWHNFFDALISADISLIQITMNEILKVGETSGADALAGFVGVFKSSFEIKSTTPQ
ncbi:MAG: DUF2877 domain-containing protein [Anaerolineales bacterium]|nr:DUF2877 domain-containing protein [Anaerolineales bacterium]